MVSKYCIGFLVACLSLTIINGAQTKISLESLKEKVTQLVENAARTLSSIVEDCAEKARELLRLITDKLAKTVADIVNRIKTHIEDARKLGKNVDNCMHNYETKIDNIQKELDKNATECIDGKLKEIKETVNQALTIKLKEYPDIIESLIQEVNDCGKNLACIRQIGMKIGKAVLSLPKKVADLVKEIKNEAAKSYNEMATCVDERFQNADKEVKAVEDEVTSCIKEVINNN